MACGKLTAMALARFQSCRFLGRSEDPETGSLQGVGNPRGQRALGSDEYQIDLFLPAEGQDLTGMAWVDVTPVWCSAIARCHDHAVTGTLQRAGHRVFASARSEHENLHAKANSKDSLGATPETSTGYFPVKQAVQ